MQRRVTTRGIILNEAGEIFAQVLKSDDGKNDFWCTPGGGLDVGESLHDGLYREMIEETGVAPKIGCLALIQQFIDRGGDEQLEFFFHIENADDYVDIDISRTSHGDIEIYTFGFIDPKTENILPKDLQRIDLPSFIRTVQPPLIINRIETDV